MKGNNENIHVDVKTCHIVILHEEDQKNLEENLKMKTFTTTYLIIFLQIFIILVNVKLLKLI